MYVCSHVYIYLYIYKYSPRARHIAAFNIYFLSIAQVYCILTISI